jgi:ribosomal protein S12 methylthiotransferase accessory factor
MGQPESCPDISAVAPFLVSQRFGIVKELRPIIPEPSQPRQPYVLQSLLANHRYAKNDDPLKGGASGKGLTMAVAQERALGEAVERYSSLFYQPQELTYARRAELAGRSIDPAQLVLYRPEQYANVDYVPYTQESMMGWASGRSLTRDELVFVPALAVYMAYNPEYPEENVFGISSNGLAAGGSLAGAVFSAALEVIERDAFLIGWSNQLLTDRWEPATHPDPEFRRLHRVYERRGIRLELFQMPTDLEVAVFLAIGVAEDDRELPAAVVGLGAHPEAQTAAWKAFLEVGQIRPALRRRLCATETQERMQSLLADPKLVERLEDHDLLYSHPGALSKLEFLRKTPVTRTEWPAGERQRDLTWLVEHLEAKGHELIYFDLTPHDMKRLGLYTARAIIPGFQPIDFGFHRLRLGGERLYQLPVQLGLRARVATPETLNSDPHPIA